MRDMAAQISKSVQLRGGSVYVPVPMQRLPSIFRLRRDFRRPVHRRCLAVLFVLWPLLGLTSWQAQSAEELASDTAALPAVGLEPDPLFD